MELDQEIVQLNIDSIRNASKCGTVICQMPQTNTKEVKRMAKYSDEEIRLSKSSL